MADKRVNLIQFPMWTKGLKVLFDNPNENMSYIGKQIDCTYSHIHKIFYQLENFGLIEIRKEGRSKYSIFTEKGKEVVKHLNAIFDLLEDEKIITVKNRKHYIEQQNTNNIVIPLKEEEYVEDEKDDKHN